MRLAAVLAAIALASHVVMVLAAPHGPAEPPWPDFRPHLMPPAPPHAWPSGVSSGDPHPAPSPAQTSGTARIVVLLVRFTDVPQDATHDAAYYEAAYNAAGPSAGSVRAYYEEVSFGGLTVQATIVPTWWSSTRTMGYYGDDGSNVDDANGSIYYLVAEAVRLADPSVDFSTFDADGDGIVDHIVVVHAGGAQEEEPTNEALIWSHRWVVVDGDRALPGSQALVA
ncbi:MAG: immune inhibitor A domain-containing protein, partial [Methanobacteriota archaeon]